MSPLSQTLTHLYCQTCGTSWAKADANGAYYFRSDTQAVGSYASPKSIFDAGEEITYCPGCDRTGPLEEHYKQPGPGIHTSPFFVGQDRMTGETEEDVRARRAELDSAPGVDPDVTHTP